VNVPSEEKCDDSKERFYEELEQVFEHFPKYHMKIISRDFNAKVVRNAFLNRQLGMKPASGQKR